MSLWLAAALWLAAGPTAGVSIAAPELDGVIAGRVCEDRNGDGRCGPGDPGIAGVRVVLETGDEARTDLEGRYHLARVDARVPDPSEGGRLLFGRHRIAVDPRTLFGGAKVLPASITVEIPMGGLVEQDFVIEGPPARPGKVERATGIPPAARIEAPQRFRFLLTGKVDPSDQVRIGGGPVDVDGSGRYSAWVALAPGTQVLTVAVLAVDGTERLYRQRIDAVVRPGSVLIVPRALEPIATVRRPGTRDQAVASGQSSVRIEGAAGTRIQGPSGETRIGPGGVAQVPVTLAPGTNDVVLTVTPPGEAPQRYDLSVRASPRVFAVGLLDLTGTFDPARSGVRLLGRGAAHAEASAFGWDFAGELVLDDRDVHEADRLGWELLGYPRFPERAQRVLDPERYPLEWNDDSITLSPNAAGGRFRLLAKKEGLGFGQFGTYAARLTGGEIGVYQREIFGPAVEVESPKSWPVAVRAKAFDGSGLFDPTRGLATAPVHQEFTSTGGSLFYLREGALSEGSETVRVVMVDGVSRTPLAERHLVRGRDYDIDYAAGRILLARPLGLVAEPSLLRTLPPSHGFEPLLVVDASRLLLSQSEPKPAGGEVEADVKGISLRVGGVDERADADYSLVRASVGVPLGPLQLWAEGASSEGLHFAPGDFAFSDDGGLSFDSPTPTARSGQALVLDLKGPGLDERGVFDLAFRRRTAGFVDGWHDDALGMHDLSLHLDQPVGPLRVAVIADDFKGPDPRPALLDSELSSRTVGGSVGGTVGRVSARIEARDLRLTAISADAPDAQTGGRTSLGLDLGYRLEEGWSLTAGHLQSLNRWGHGLGRVDDTFSSAGVRYEAGNTSGELRGGWGPALGFQLLGSGQLRRGDDTFYGGYSVDVDGPDFGTQRAISGVSSRVGDRSAIFTEDVAAHDATAIRLSRAVGVTESLASGLSVTARFERGYRTPLDVYEPLAREVGGLTVEWVTPRIKTAARAELRLDRGHVVSAPGESTAVDRTQRLLGGAIQAQLLESLRASARFDYADTYASDVREARFLEGTAGLAWRTEPGIWQLQYSVTRELAPPPRAFGERTLQVISLLPAYTFDRFSVAAGGHVGISTDAGETTTVLSGSIRPGVRVWRGVELALEAARRTATMGGGGLTALRAELGYRIDSHALIAAGYTFFGYSGLGLSPNPDDHQDRLYVRAELGL